MWSIRYSRRQPRLTAPAGPGRVPLACGLHHDALRHGIHEQNLALWHGTGVRVRVAIPGPVFKKVTVLPVVEVRRTEPGRRLFLCADEPARARRSGP